MELEGEIDKCKIIDRDFKTLLLVIDRTSRQKIKKNVYDLNTNQLDFTDTYVIEHSSTEEQPDTHSFPANMEYSPR